MSRSTQTPCEARKYLDAIGDNPLALLQNALDNPQQIDWIEEDWTGEWSVIHFRDGSSIVCSGPTVEIENDESEAADDTCTA